METAIVILLGLTVGMLGFIAGATVSRRRDSSQPDAPVTRTLENLSARLVERPDVQPDFWPWTQLLNSAANRQEIVQELMKSRENEDGSLSEQVRFLACAQVATLGLLVESLERDAQVVRPTVEERELELESAVS